MDIITSQKFSNVIIPNRFFLLIDNKGNRKFCTTDMKKVKMQKTEIDLTFFENKNLNTFWDIAEKDNYKQVSNKDFFNEGLCNINYKSS